MTSSILPRVEEYSFEYEINISEANFDTKGRHFFRFTIESALNKNFYNKIEVKETGMDHFDQRNKAETDTVKLTNIDNPIKFKETEFIFKVPQGFCTNERSDNVYLLLESFVRPKLGAKGTKSGEAKVNIYPRTENPKIKTPTSNSGNLYDYTDVISLVSDDGTKAGTIKCKFVLTGFHSGKATSQPKTPIISPVPRSPQPKTPSITPTPKSPQPITPSIKPSRESRRSVPFESPQITPVPSNGSRSPKHVPEYRLETVSNVALPISYKHYARYNDRTNPVVYRAELESRMTYVRDPPSPRLVPYYAKIMKNEPKHHCTECAQLHFEIERLRLQLEEKSIGGTRYAMMDSRESHRSVDYRQNTDWRAIWAGTPDLLSNHSRGESPNRRRHYQDLEDEVRRLKWQLQQLRSIEHKQQPSRNSVRPVSIARSLASGPLNLPSPEPNHSSQTPQPNPVVDSVSLKRLASLYLDVYSKDWAAANKVLLNDKVKQEKSAEILLGILTDAFSYCEKAAEDQLKTIINSSLHGRDQRNANPSNDLSRDQAEIQKEAEIFRNKIAENTLKSIIKSFRYDVFMKKRTFNARQKENLDITRYVDKCVNITWYIAIQNCPIILDNSVKRNTSFNFETYSSFDKNDRKGNAVYDYLVWPSLTNAENNTPLCKGVAKIKA